MLRMTWVDKQHVKSTAANTFRATESYKTSIVTARALKQPGFNINLAPPPFASIKLRAVWEEKSLHREVGIPEASLFSCMHSGSS